MKNCFAFLIALLLLCGCKRKDIQSINAFKEEHLLSSVLIPIDPDDIKYPIYILCASDYINYMYKP